MGTFTIISPARCRDCKFLKPVVGRYKNGRVKITYVCDGPGITNGQRRAMRDLVCDDWKPEGML